MKITKMLAVVHICVAPMVLYGHRFWAMKPWSKQYAVQPLLVWHSFGKSVALCPPTAYYACSGPDIRGTCGHAIFWSRQPLLVWHSFARALCPPTEYACLQF